MEITNSKNKTKIKQNKKMKKKKRHSDLKKKESHLNKLPHMPIQILKQMWYKSSRK